MKDVIIIGGGASGILSAISIKEALGEGINVTIVDRLERIGKKILASGNGKCNFTNAMLKQTMYNCPSFMSKVLRKVNSKFLIDYFQSMGLWTSTLTEGRVYPLSENSSSLLEVLRLRLKNLSIRINNSFEVRRITNTNNKYILESTRNYKLECDYVVIATGGKSYPVLGSNGSGYSLLKPYKIRITDTQPGLVGIKCDQSDIKGLSGLRVKCLVKLISRKTKIEEVKEFGEVQFKEDGISGIVIMNISSIISRKLIIKEPNNYYLELDLLNNISGDDLLTYLINRKDEFAAFNVTDFLTGFFHKNLAYIIYKKCKIDVGLNVQDLTINDLIKISEQIKSFNITIKQFYGFDKSQVTVGGIELDEINPETFELIKLPNVYCIGEILNVDGVCGGSNLHFAFASGYIAGKAIVMKETNNE